MTNFGIYTHPLVLLWHSEFCPHSMLKFDSHNKHNEFPKHINWLSNAQFPVKCELHT
jgi:hypothetical protein